MVPIGAADLASEVVNFQSICSPEVSGILDEDEAKTAAAFEAITSPEAQLELGDPPLMTRKEKQARKGLPEYHNLLALARVWLNQAHDLWPELANAGLIPPAGESSVKQLVRDFRQRFISGQVDEFITPAGRKPWTALAAGYLRYSDDNSNPRSLDDQLGKEMKKAREQGRFIPWEYVFADASVTGRTHLRRGYRLAKDALERFKDTDLDTLYFDDFGRATRTGIESYRLAKLMERLDHRLIGVSDNFDLSSPAAKIHIAAIAMFNEWFIEQLRAKVLRGMKGAAERGTVLGKLRFGYKLTPLLDKHGKPVINTGKDKVINVPAKDPDALEWVSKAAHWFADDLKSYKWIARQFNTHKVGGSTSWTGSKISKMLACPIYIGVVIFNRFHAVFDTETAEITIHENPRRDWVVRKMPELRAWNNELWRKVRRRAAFVREHAPNTGKKYNRSEVYPVALLSEVLVCGSCKHEMQLIRSDTKKNYKQYGCPNGCNHVGTCQQHSSKSTRLVDTSVLDYIDQKVLTPERITEMVTLANKHLADEANRPKILTQPLKDQLRKLSGQEESLTEFVLAHQDAHNMGSYLKKGDQIREQITQLQKQLREAEATNAAPPPPLDVNQVLAYLEDMRGLLNQSVEKSAAVMRTLVGKIVVREVREPGKHWTSWVGEIQTDLVQFMAKAAREKNYPWRATSELLCIRRWIKPHAEQIPLDVPRYAQLAPKALEIYTKTKSINAMASALGLTWKPAKQILEFARTGHRPVWESSRGKQRRNKQGRGRKYRDIADDVARLKDQEKLSWPAIAKWLKENRGIVVAGGTVRRAWELGHEAAVLAAAENGVAPAGRQCYCHLGASKYQQIREGLVAGKKPEVIAAEVGCGVSTIYRARRNPRPVDELPKRK